MLSQENKEACRGSSFYTGVHPRCVSTLRLDRTARPAGENKLDPAAGGGRKKERDKLVEERYNDHGRDCAPPFIR